MSASGSMTLWDGRVGKLMINVQRLFDDDMPCRLEVNGVAWRMTVDDARRLVRAATGARKMYSARLGGEGETPFVIEVDSAHFLFGSSCVAMTDELLFVLSRLIDTRPSPRAHQLQVDLQGYRSPLGGPWSW
jgi:hypothetical protein